MRTREPWPAPRTAYLLTAAAAEDDGQAAWDIWRELPAAAQADVLRALAAQCRVALRAMPAGHILGLDVSALAAEICREAFTAMQALLDEERPWDAPACPHCRKEMAGALTSIAVSAGRGAGLSAELIAYHCRQAADRHGTAV